MSLLDPADELKGPAPDLSRQAVRSGFIQLGGQAALALLTFGSGIALARLLTPADFGLVAMAYTLTTFVGTFRDLGLPMATVHHEGLEHRHVSALFWIALKLNLLIALFLLAMAPVVAWVYGQPRLVAVVAVLAGAVFATGIAAQHQSLLVRRMRFGRLTAIDVGATVAGIVAAVGGAVAGAGYWALVLQTVVFSVTRSATLWGTSRWRPSRRVGGMETMPEVRSLLSYGGHYTGFLVLGHLSRHLDRMLIGYFRGPTTLGLYDGAWRWAQYPQTAVFPPLLGVAVSGLSRKQRDPEGYRSAARKAFLCVLAFLMPASAFLAVEARSVVLALFGERWLPAVPILRVLSVGAFITGTGRLTTWLFLSRGETRRQFHWALRYAPVMALGVVIGIPWGAFGVAVGVTVANWLLAYPRIAFCLETSPLRVRDFLAVIARPAAASIAAAAVLLAIQPLLVSEEHAIARVAVALAVFGVAYAGAWLLVPGGRRTAGELLGILASAWRLGARSETRLRVMPSPLPPPLPQEAD